MRRLLLAALLIAFAQPAGAAETLQAQTKAWSVTPDTRLQFEFPVGGLRVEATDDSKVRLELLVKCKRGSIERCERFAEGLTLDVDHTARQLRVEVEGYPKFGHSGITLHGTLLVPRGMTVKLEMGVGDLELEGLEGDLEVDLGVGEAELLLGAASYRTAEVEVGVGDASLRAAGRRRSSSGFIGRSVSWTEGTGTSRAKLHVGVGDANVRMD